MDIENIRSERKRVLHEITLEGGDINAQKNAWKDYDAEQKRSYINPEDATDPS